jgi:hypothetical protein
MRPACPFPPHLDCTLRYGHQVTLSTTSSQDVLGTEQAFLLNSIFDPDYTGVGHQPYYHDQLQAIYGQYIVTAAEIRATFSDPSSDGVAIACQMNGSTQGTTVISGNNIFDYMERPNTALLWLNDSGNQVCRLNQKINLPELEGVSLQQYMANDNYRADFAVSPAKKMFFRAAASNTVSTATFTVSFAVEIIFHVRCYSRKLPSAS